MNDQELEDLLRRALKQNFSQDTEAFSDALLVRCLAEIDALVEGTDLADADLGLLAAAGCTHIEPASFEDNG